MTLLRKTLILALLAPPLAAQEPGAEAAPAEPDPGRVEELLALPLPGDFLVSEVAESGFTVTRDHRLEFHARDLDVVDVFAQLRELTQQNVVLAPGVSATFTGDLYDLTPQQAVEMICRATGLTAKEEDGYVYVTNARPEPRVFVLENARAQDLVPVLTPLVGDGGKVTASTLSKQGIGMTEGETGGDDFAYSDVLVVSALPEVMAEIEEIVTTFDRTPKQLLLEATILSAALHDEMALGIDFQALGGVSFRAWGASSGDGTSMSGGGFGGGEMDQGTHGLNSDVSGALPGGGLSYGFINGDVGAFLRAVQSITNTSILANTKITTLNKQLGEVLLGRKDGYLTTTVSETSTTQTIEFIETGTHLIYRPFIGDDGIIRLEVKPEDSEGGLNDQGLPFKDTAEVSTNIMVRDGQTVVIGGLFREKVKSEVSKVPVVGDIPFFGQLFRGNSDSTVREEIIVLLTPHIIDVEAELAVSEASGPAVDLGGDRDPVHRLYLHAARGLAAHGDCGSALYMLLASGHGLAPSAEETVRREFAALRDRVRLDRSESSWRDLPWLTSYHEGLVAAARGDKPLLLWVMNGHPLGCT